MSDDTKTTDAEYGHQLPFDARFQAACAAMNGMCSAPEFMNEVITLASSKEEACGLVARWAVMQADALLAALDGGET